MLDLLGPQVAIVDDREEEVLSITETLDGLNIGNKFFKVDPVEPVFPDKPLETVELVFLDLHYNNGFGAEFNPYACADWLLSIVPPLKKYTLVIWSKDTDKTGELLQVMNEMHVPAPFMVVSKQKNLYQKADNEYDIKKLLNEVRIGLEEKNHTDVIELSGEIIDLEDEHILVNCLVNEEHPTFQVRRFDRLPLEHLELRTGNYLKIKITTEQGIRKFEFFEENDDLSEKFRQQDFFKGLENNRFIGNSDEGNV